MVRYTKCVFGCFVAAALMVIVATSCRKTNGTYLCYCEVKDANGKVIHTEYQDTHNSGWGSAAATCETDKAATAGIWTAIDKTNSVSCSLK